MNVHHILFHFSLKTMIGQVLCGSQYIQTHSQKLTHQLKDSGFSKLTKERQREKGRDILEDVY